MYCINCGNQVSDQAKFCSKCGVTMKEVSQEGVPSTVDLKKETSINKVKNFLVKNKIVVGILVLVLAIFGYMKFIHTDGSIKGTWQYSDESSTVIAEVGSRSKILLTAIDNYEGLSFSLEGELEKYNQSYLLDLLDSKVTISGPSEGYTKEEIIDDIISSNNSKEAYDFLYKNSEIKDGKLSITIDFGEVHSTVAKLILDSMHLLDSKMTYTFTPVNNNVLQVNLGIFDEEVISLMKR